MRDPGAVRLEYVWRSRRVFAGAAVVSLALSTPGCSPGAEEPSPRTPPTSEPSPQASTGERTALPATDAGPPDSQGPPPSDADESRPES